jgi:hypothetical protein
MTDRKRTTVGGVLMAIGLLALVYSVCKPASVKPCGDVLTHSDVRGCHLTEGKTR